MRKPIRKINDAVITIGYNARRKKYVDSWDKNKYSANSVAGSDAQQFPPLARLHFIFSSPVERFAENVTSSLFTKTYRIR